MLAWASLVRASLNFFSYHVTELPQLLCSTIGRRVLHTYLTLFLHSSSASDPEHDYELIASRTLNTYALGQHVAPKWNLGRILRWYPAASVNQVQKNMQYDARNRGGPGNEELTVLLRTHPQLVKSVGLYKVMGEAVQAIVGGVYHQFVRWNSNFWPR